MHILLHRGDIFVIILLNIFSMLLVGKFPPFVPMIYRSSLFIISHIFQIPCPYFHIHLFLWLFEWSNSSTLSSSSESLSSTWFILLVRVFTEAFYFWCWTFHFQYFRMIFLKTAFCIFIQLPFNTCTDLFISLTSLCSPEIHSRVSLYMLWFLWANL